MDKIGYNMHISSKFLSLTNSGVAKAGPGQAHARPKFVPLMSSDLARSEHEC